MSRRALPIIVIVSGIRVHLLELLCCDDRVRERKMRMCEVLDGLLVGRKRLELLKRYA